jgi:Ras-related GTP-binding protein A/B
MDLLNSARRQDIYTDRVKDLRGKAKELGATELSWYGTSIWDETLYRAWSRIIHALIPNIATLESNLTEFTKITAATEAVIFEKTTFLVIARSGGDTVAKSVGSAADKAKASAGPGSSPSSKRTANTNRLSTVSSHGTLADDKESDSLLEGYPPTEAERKALLARGEMHPERFEKISELVKNLRGSCNKLQASFEAFEVRGATFSAYLDVFTENTYIMVIVADPRVGKFMTRDA